MSQPHNKNKYPLSSTIKAPQQALRRMHGEEEATKQMLKACREWGEAGGAGTAPDPKP